MAANRSAAATGAQPPSSTSETRPIVSATSIRQSASASAHAIERSPGPIAVDLAYGERNRNIKLHFSVAIAF
jgi:hypothetical protein